MESIVIVGCGSLGSALAEMCVSKAEDYRELKRLYLVDPDVLESHNYPYLNVNQNHGDKNGYTNSPKVHVAAVELSRSKPSHIDIVPIYDIYPLEVEPIPTRDTYWVDCRDTHSECNQFDLKCCLDGGYGRFVIKPDDSMLVPGWDEYGLRRNKYAIGRSVYFSKLMVAFMSQIIFNDRFVGSKYPKGRYIIDLGRGGKIYDY